MTDKNKTAESQEQHQPFLTYEKPSNGIRIQYPADWQLVERSDQFEEESLCCFYGNNLALVLLLNIIAQYVTKEKEELEKKIEIAEMYLFEDIEEEEEEEEQQEEDNNNG